MADDGGAGKKAFGPSWGWAYVVGAVLLADAARLSAPDGSPEPAARLLPFAGLCFAIGVWSLPAALNGLLRRAGPRLRRLAGTPEVFLRPGLAAAALVAFVWVILNVWSRLWLGDRTYAVVGFVVLGISSVFVVLSGPSAYARWKSIGDLVLRLAEPKVRRGETVRAALEAGRAVRVVSASVRHFASDGDEEKDYLKSKRPAAVAAEPAEDGVFRFSVGAEIAAAAPPTVVPPEDDDGKAPWSRWELEVVAAGEDGAETTASAEFVVV